MMLNEPPQSIDENESYEFVITPQIPFSRSHHDKNQISLAAGIPTAAYSFS